MLPLRYINTRTSEKHSVEKMDIAWQDRFNSQLRFCFVLLQNRSYCGRGRFAGRPISRFSTTGAREP